MFLEICRFSVFDYWRSSTIEIPPPWDNEGEHKYLGHGVSTNIALDWRLFRDSDAVIRHMRKGRVGTDCFGAIVTRQFPREPMVRVSPGSATNKPRESRL
ncbi:uncharacterized protein APUU_10837S [Aspergillus puulaauensis]|uniref:Uncharacterized protein n=1 Tax=Aspergillus puulaauensis TaxID=1220207 RepID=A0A7R8AFX1_9EURO|nr:uncharacterized protein APUU_10837S [Aspergillus puulaauensis]BCS18009.1 hypothetical protein APUU_10837S [Aspergillus puulaauensis]